MEAPHNHGEVCISNTFGSLLFEVVPGQQKGNTWCIAAKWKGRLAYSASAGMWGNCVWTHSVGPSQPGNVCTCRRCDFTIVVYELRNAGRAVCPHIIIIHRWSAFKKADTFMHINIYFALTLKPNDHLTDFTFWYVHTNLLMIQSPLDLKTHCMYFDPECKLSLVSWAYLLW